MTQDERHNAFCNILGEAFWGFQWALVLPSTVLTVLLSELGARSTTIGLLPTLEGATLLMQMVGIYLFRAHKTRKSRLLAWHFWAMIPFLAGAGVVVLLRDHFPLEWLATAVLLCWALYVLSIGVVGAAWQDWIAHLFEERIRGTITGLGWGLSSLAGVGATLIAGYLLRLYPGMDTYGWLYIAAAGGAYLSIFVFLFVRDPSELGHHQAPHLSEIIGATKASLMDRNFRAILIGRALAIIGFCVGPFIAVHYLSPAGGSLSSSRVVSLGAAQTLGAAITCVGFGRLGDRVGHKLGVLTGALLQVACLLFVLFVPGSLGCGAAFLCAGAVGGIQTVSYMNLVIESCPHGIRSAHLMIGNVTVGIALLLVPLAGSRLAEQQGIPTLMAVSLAISIVAAAWFMLKVKDPRQLRPTS